MLQQEKRTTPLMTFLDGLLEAGRKEGRTQEDVARDLGLNTTTFASYRLGHRKPRLPRLRRMARIAGVDWHDLIDEEDDPGDDETEHSKTDS